MRMFSRTGVVLVGIVGSGLLTVAGCGGQADHAAPHATASSSSASSPAAPSEPATTAAPVVPSTAASPAAPTASQMASPALPPTVARPQPRLMTKAPAAAMRPKMASLPEKSQEPQYMLAPALEEAAGAGSSLMEPSMNEVPQPATAPPPMMAQPNAAAPRAMFQPDAAKPPPTMPQLEAAAPPPTMPQPRAAEATKRVAPPAASPPVSAPRAPQSTDAKSGDYTTVTVFYGTDRLPLENVGSTTASYLIWIAGTATCAVGAVLLAILAIRLRRRWLLATGFALGSALTAILTMVAVLAMPMAAANPSLARVYGNGRGPVEMGTCQVSIPKCHEVGEVERPSILRLEFQEDPTQHVVLLKVAPEPEDAFFTKLRDRVERSTTGEAFVFVHGFNVTFEAAARRTAQLAYDLKFEGAPIFYSWPSQGGLLQYTVDETNVAWTVSHLKNFLMNVAHRSGARSVHLIAHSMGNRALTAALQMLTYEVKQQIPRFGQVVLTAPDIDADIFQRDIAPAIVQMANRVTLYASSNDEALLLSKQIHGYPRAGDTGARMLVIPGIDTIDVSSVDTSLIGHSYYGSNHSVLEDLWDLLHESKPPGQRQWLHPIQLGKLMYWVFRSEQARLQAAELPRAEL